MWLFLKSLAELKLKENDSSLAHWSDELEGFIIGDGAWYQKLKEYVEELPEMLDIEVANDEIINIMNKISIPISIDDVRKIVLNEYSMSGKVYLKKRMSLSKIYLAVLEKYYPDGIKLYDGFETMRFRGYVREMFGDIELPENNRAIDARLASLTVLCDRGKYILPSRINIPGELLQKIHDTIIGYDRNIIMFAELFERFKSELLENSNITNRYFLQGVLKYHYSNEFYFTRDTLCKDGLNEASIHFAIEKFIKDEGRAVTKDEIRNEFKGISDAVLLNAFYTNPNLVAWDYGQYIHSSMLIIDEKDRERIRAVIEEYVSQGVITSRKLFDVFCGSELEFVRKNNIQTHIALFGILQYMFEDEYEFKRPFIGCKGNMTLTMQEVIRDYLSQYDSFKISELQEYCQDKQVKIASFEVLLDDISEEFLRVDADLCIRRNLINISHDIISLIEDITVGYLGNVGYVSLRKINDFFFYPEIGFTWTPFLLESIIKKYSKRLKIIELPTRDYRYLSGIIVDIESGFETYEDILRHALKTESEQMPFKNVNEIEKWLVEQELIIKRIPESLFHKDIISENEYGEIRIL